MKRTVRKALVDRPGDVGMDLPAGVTAKDLGPADYHPVDMEAPEQAPLRRVRAPARGARRPAPARR